MRPWPQQSSKCRAVKDSPSPVAAASSAKVRSGTRRNRTAHLLNAIQELVPVAPFRCQLRRLGDRTSKARGRHHGHEDALSLAPHALPRGNSGSRNNSKFSRPCDCAQSTTAGRPSRLRKTTGSSCFRSRSGPVMCGRCEHTGVSARRSCAQWPWAPLRVEFARRAASRRATVQASTQACPSEPPKGEEARPAGTPGRPVRRPSR